MWPMLILVSAGHPVMSVSNTALAAVIVPLASFVVFSVNVPLPVHDASGLVIGGTSFEGLRSAVNTNLVCGVGDGLGVGDAVGDGAAAGLLQALSSSTAAVTPESKRMDTSSCTAVIRSRGGPG